jgi:hypothetical protein
MTMKKFSCIGREKYSRALAKELARKDRKRMKISITSVERKYSSTNTENGSKNENV